MVISQLNKLKSSIKKRTEATLNLLSNVIGDCNDETIFPHKLLLTDAQVLWLRKASTNGLTVNIELSKTELSKIGQLGGFLGKIIGPLLKINLPLMKNVIKSLAKRVFVPLGLKA